MREVAVPKLVESAESVSCSCNPMHDVGETEEVGGVRRAWKRKFGEEDVRYVRSIRFWYFLLWTSVRADGGFKGKP